jgi:SpoVK/Ycf46/Vps4 family AAA+-type ATPase
MAKLPTKPATDSPLEDALLDITRLSLAGDLRAVRQRTRNMLRGGRDAPLRAELREYLGQLLADLEPVAPALRQAASAPPLRFAEPESPDSLEPVEPTTSALFELDHATDAIAPMLEPQAATALDRLIAERRSADRLRQAGVPPSKTLLLSGPPGTGKSMSARFLARQLGLPLLRTQPATVMSSLMGQSSRNLRDIIRIAGETPTVLLLDEFDAYARRRDDVQDIAEPKRFVNALLMELDSWPDTGLLVAATNHPGLLDPAIARRFEVHLELGLPGLETRCQLLEQALARTGRRVDGSLIECCAQTTVGLSGSDLVTRTRTAVRTSVLEDIAIEVALVDVFVRGQLNGRDRATSRARERFAVFARRHTSMSLRDIGEVLGVSHVAVGQMLKRTIGQETNAFT